jgi:hypothetical protein
MTAAAVASPALLAAVAPAAQKPVPSTLVRRALDPSTDYRERKWALRAAGALGDQWAFASLLSVLRPDEQGAPQQPSSLIALALEALPTTVLEAGEAQAWARAAVLDAAMVASVLYPAAEVRGAALQCTCVLADGSAVNELVAECISAAQSVEQLLQRRFGYLQPPLRRAVAESVGALVTKGGEGMAERLLAGLSSTWGFLQASPELRVVGVLLAEAIMTAMMTKEALAVLAQCLSDPDPEVRGMACTALGRACDVHRQPAMVLSSLEPAFGDCREGAWASIMEVALIAARGRTLGQNEVRQAGSLAIASLRDLASSGDAIPADTYKLFILLGEYPLAVAPLTSRAQCLASALPCTSQPYCVEAVEAWRAAFAVSPKAFRGDRAAQLSLRLGEEVVDTIMAFRGLLLSASDTITRAMVSPDSVNAEIACEVARGLSNLVVDADVHAPPPTAELAATVTMTVATLLSLASAPEPFTSCKAAALRALRALSPALDDASRTVALRSLDNPDVEVVSAGIGLLARVCAAPDAEVMAALRETFERKACVLQPRALGLMLGLDQMHGTVVETCLSTCLSKSHWCVKHALLQAFRVTVARGCEAVLRLVEPLLQDPNLDICQEAAETLIALAPAGYSAVLFADVGGERGGFVQDALANAFATEQGSALESDVGVLTGGAGSTTSSSCTEGASHTVSSASGVSSVDEDWQSVTKLIRPDARNCVLQSSCCFAPRGRVAHALNRKIGDFTSSPIEDALLIFDEATRQQIKLENEAPVLTSSASEIALEEHFQTEAMDVMEFQTTEDLLNVYDDLLALHDALEVESEQLSAVVNAIVYGQGLDSDSACSIDASDAISSALSSYVECAHDDELQSDGWDLV